MYNQTQETPSILTKLTKHILFWEIYRHQLFITSGVCDIHLRAIYPGHGHMGAWSLSQTVGANRGHDASSLQGSCNHALRVIYRCQLARLHASGGGKPYDRTYITTRREEVGFKPHT